MFRVSSLSIIPQMLHNPLHFNIYLLRRTSGRSLGMLKQQNVLFISGQHNTQNTFKMFSCLEVLNGFLCPTYCLLTPWSRVLLQKLTGFQLVKKFPVLYGILISLQNSQVPATCPYPEPIRSSPYPHIPLPEDPS